MNMTVKELIKTLQLHDQDANVFIGFGPIKERQGVEIQTYPTDGCIRIFDPGDLEMRLKIFEELRDETQASLDRLRGVIRKDINDES